MPKVTNIPRSCVKSFNSLAGHAKLLLAWLFQYTYTAPNQIINAEQCMEYTDSNTHTEVWPPRPESLTPLWTFV